MTNSMIRFFDALETNPRIEAIFDREKKEYSPEKLCQFMSTASSGEKIMATFFVAVWRHQIHSDYPFDILDIGGLDLGNRRVIVDWILNPYWP